MKNVITFTTTLSPKIMTWLNSYSQKNNLTKREVIERALNIYKENIVKLKLKETFNRAFQDPEMAYLTEEGISDYNKQLKNLDI